MPCSEGTGKEVLKFLEKSKYRREVSEVYPYSILNSRMHEVAVMKSLWPKAPKEQYYKCETPRKTDRE